MKESKTLAREREMGSECYFMMLEMFVVEFGGWGSLRRGAAPQRPALWPGSLYRAPMSGLLRQHVGYLEIEGSRIGIWTKSEPTL
jgi:hypothetical protein